MHKSTVAKTRHPSRWRSSMRLMNVYSSSVECMKTDLLMCEIPSSVYFPVPSCWEANRNQKIRHLCAPFLSDEHKKDEVLNKWNDTKENNTEQTDKTRQHGVCPDNVPRMSHWCWRNTENSWFFHFLMHQHAGHCQPLLNSWLFLNFHSSHMLRLSQSDVNEQVTDGSAVKHHTRCYVSAFLAVGHDCLCRCC